MTRGLAGVKFSGSPRRLGENRAKLERGRSIRMKPRMSLREKYGWKGILSQLDEMPRGLFEPDSWSRVR